MYFLHAYVCVVYMSWDTHTDNFDHIVFHTRSCPSYECEYMYTSHTYKHTQTHTTEIYVTIFLIAKMLNTF